MSSEEKKSKKSEKKTDKAKTKIDDLEPTEDDDVKGGATLSLATSDATRLTSADYDDTARKITPTDLSYKITPETKPTTR